MIKKLKSVSIGVVVLCLSGCYRPTIEPELNKIHAMTESRIENNLPSWNVSKSFITELHAEQGIYLSDAIINALITDPELRSLFAKVGISRADLDQAGYPANPKIGILLEGAIYDACPAPLNVFDGYFDIRGSFNLSDFWQIPYRKKVANDEVDIAVQASYERIVAIASETTLAYYEYIYARDQFKTVKKIVDVLENIVQMADDKLNHNLITDYDLLVAKAKLNEWQIKLLQQDEFLYNALINVRNTLGLFLLPEEVNLMDDWERLMQNLTSSEKLFEEAEKNNPGLAILQLKIRQAKHQQSLVRSKIIDNVEFGVDYSRFPIAEPYLGPYINFDLPIFDYQQAQMERTRRLEEQYIHEYNNALSTLRQDILTLHKTISISQAKIKQYQQHLLVTTHDALSYAHYHPEKIHMNFLLFVDTEVRLLEQEYKLNEERYALVKAVATLEKRLGRSLWLKQ